MYNYTIKFKRKESEANVVVNNLDPATLRGVESFGMLLAASDDDGVSVVSPDRKVKLGSIVK